MEGTLEPPQVQHPTEICHCGPHSLQLPFLHPQSSLGHPHGRWTPRTFPEMLQLSTLAQMSQTPETSVPRAD